MFTHSRYVIIENIERFEILLRDGQLDSRQIQTVEFLLAQARDDLTALDVRDIRLVAGQAVAVFAALAGVATTLA
jgi:hypothetical protein